MALPAARNRRKSKDREPSLPDAGGAARSASPIPSSGEGRLAHLACWGGGPLGLEFGPPAHFDQ
eukprot:205795-Alexandrium_andersonii.AAC.1